MVSKIYKLSEDELRTILKVLTLTRNSCAHRNRLYCLKHTISLPHFDSTHHPNASIFTSRGDGNKNLFSVMICMSLLLENRRMKPLVNAIDNEIQILSKK